MCDEIDDEKMRVDCDRYRMIVMWAGARYRDEKGVLVVSRGGVPSRYSEIEALAFDRYVRPYVSIMRGSAVVDSDSLQKV